VTGVARHNLRYSYGVDLKALSVRQPWAGLLARGVKRFEVRSWRPSHLGLYILHASSGKPRDIRDHREEPLFQRALLRADMKDEANWDQGALIAVVKIVRVWGLGAWPKGLTSLDKYLSKHGPNDFLWEVGRRWVFNRPIPCDGALRLWTPPPETRRALAAQLSRLKVPLPRE